MGYGAVFSVLTDSQKDAEQMQAQISAMLVASNPNLPLKPSKRFAGMTDFQTPVALLSFGPREAKDGWRYEIVLGTMGDVDAVTAALPKPARGLEPVMRARLDLGGLNPAITMGQAMAGNRPEVAEGIQGLQKAGIGGDHPLKVSYQSGFTESGSMSISVIENAKSLGFGAEPLSNSDMAAVPSDVTEVFLTKGGAGLENQLDVLAAKMPPVQEGLDKFQAATGVDFRNDVLAALGGTAAVYLSDATGGGSLGSAVFMVSIRDKARFASALNKLVAVGNMAADQIPIGPGYVRLMTWKDPAGDMLSLRFPGLPVPLEITIAMTDKWLIAAPTPQAAIAAARQASGHGDSGLTANRAFTAGFKGDRKVVSLSFSDTARNLHEAYPFLSFLGSAVANAVRSPTDPSREPGMLVPLFADLRRDAKAWVSQTFWDGDDLVTETRGDRSMLVNAGGSIGVLSKILPLIVLPAAAAAGEKHRFGQLGQEATPGARAILALASGAIPELAVRRSALQVLHAFGSDAVGPVAMSKYEGWLVGAAQP
jgi:hypothetical protein